MKKTLFLASLLLFIARTWSADADHPQAEKTNENIGIPEIIVTAQKRTENIQKVPIAVSAFSGDTLSASGVENTQQLSTLVPSLSYGTAAGFASVYLRGIGSDVSQPESEPSVATFQDGVYIASQQGLVSQLLAVDRVEVLAGPQGTLYGRNASAGAINVYSLTPQQQFEAATSVSYGSLNSAFFSGRISGGVNQRLSVGLYGVLSIQDSAYTFLPPVAVGQRLQNKNWGARLKTVWEPLDGFKLIGSVEKITERTVDDGLYKQIQSNSLGVGFGGTFVQDKRLILADTPQFHDVDTTLAILREQFDLGFANLVGISSWRDSRPRVQNDYDGTQLNLVVLGAPMPTQQESQEIQLLSRPDSVISWIGGLYFFHELSGFEPLYIRSGLLFQPSPIYTSALTATGTTGSYAAYAQMTAPLDFINPAFRLTLGGRFTRDRKTRDPLQQRFLTVDGADVLPPTFSPGLENTWSKFTPKVAVEYQTDPALYYLTFAQGYKSGEFNLSGAGQDTAAQPEGLKDYEAGVKSDWLEKRLRLNLAAYYYDFKNLQVEVLDPSGTLSAVVRNAAGAKAYGLELTSSAVLIPSLTASVDAAWEHTKYTTFQNAPYFLIGGPTGNTEILGHDASGLSLKQAPDFVGTVSVDYRVPLASGDQFDLKGSLYHNSGFKFDQFGQVKQSPYNLLNASLTYTLPHKPWKLSFWGENLTNTQYFAYEAISQFGTVGSGLSVRKVGASLSYEMH